MTYSPATIALAARIVAIHDEVEVGIEAFTDSRAHDMDELCTAVEATLTEVMDAHAYLNESHSERLIPVAASVFGNDLYTQHLEYADGVHPVAVHMHINEEHMRAPLTYTGESDTAPDSFDDYALEMAPGMPPMSADPDDDVLYIKSGPVYLSYAIGAYDDMPQGPAIAAHIRATLTGPDYAEFSDDPEEWFEQNMPQVEEADRIAALTILEGEDALTEAIERRAADER